MEQGGPVVQPARWYYLEGREQRGPMPLADIRARVLDATLQPDTYVWADGMPGWLHVRQVPALTPPPELRAGLDAWR